LVQSLAAAPRTYVEAGDTAAMAEPRSNIRNISTRERSAQFGVVNYLPSEIIGSLKVNVNLNRILLTFSACMKILQKKTIMKRKGLDIDIWTAVLVCPRS
jgi:hypothetical protein